MLGLGVEVFKEPQSVFLRIRGTGINEVWESQRNAE